MAGEAWSDSENDATVATYFAMLKDEVAGRAYNKSAHRRALAAKIGRGEGAIEFKHQNISFILKSLGEVWIWGYKPLHNYQDKLVDAVARWLAKHSDWSMRAPKSISVSAFREAPSLQIGVAPTMSNAPPAEEVEKAEPIARRFNVAGRDARNRALGQAGEELVFHYERSTLRAAGRDDLSDAVEWVSRDQGDGAGYDIASFEPDGSRRHIEVKTTNGWSRTPFFISRNELDVAEARPESWVLLRVHDFERMPRAFELRPPLERHVSLMATEYRASFE